MFFSFILEKNIRNELIESINSIRPPLWSNKAHTANLAEFFRIKGISRFSHYV